MRNLILPAFLLIAATLNAQRFEGIVEFTITQGATSGKTTWYVKGDSVRIDYSSATDTVVHKSYVVDCNARTGFILDHNTKISRLPVSDPQSLWYVPVDTTVNRKTFFNYEAKEFVVKPKDGTVLHYWVNTDAVFCYWRPLQMMTFDADKDSFDSPFTSNFWNLPPPVMSYLPMLVTQHDSEGKEIGRMEITRLEKHTISESLFVTPKDYKKQ